MKKNRKDKTGSRIGRKELKKHCAQRDLYKIERPLYDNES